MFKLGIKPSVLIQKKVLEKINFDYSLYNHLELGTSILISHIPINKESYQGESYTYEIGVALGYYPESCKEFWNNNLKDEFIHFGAIHFNTKGYTEESLTWCKERYTEAMLKEYTKVIYTIDYLQDRMLIEKKVGIITKRVKRIT